MYPILLRLGTVNVPSYFLLVTCSYLLASYLFSRRALLEEADPVVHIDLALVMGVAGFIGARLFHVLLVMPRFYFQHPLAVFKFWYGGFVLYGGLIGGLLGGLLFCRWRQLAIAVIADRLMPPLTLAMGLGRLGCFLAGCCYGRATTWGWPFSVIFSSHGDVLPQASPLDTPLIPSQIVDALFCLILYFGLLLYRQHKRQHGMIAGLFLVTYSSGRFFTELLRNDEQRGVYLHGWLSSAQIVSIVLVGLGVWFMVLAKRGQRATGTVSSL